jgi:hypothetical protein
MSFDVYLHGPEYESECSECCQPVKRHDTYFERNYTSNMGAFFALVLDGVETAEPEKRCDSRDGIFGKPHKDGLKANPRGPGACDRAVRERR